VNAQTSIAEIANVEQQLEQHAQNVERIQRDAIFEIGRELAAAQELYRNHTGLGGFTGWLAARLPNIPQSSAYRAIEIYSNLGGELITHWGNLSPRTLQEVAKAQPDVQELIAERVKAGEYFTAKQVQAIRQDAENKARQDALEATASAAQKAADRIANLNKEISEGAANSDALKKEVKRLKSVIADHEAEMEELAASIPSPAEAEKQAAEIGGVVIGKDLKFHSGATVEDKALTADYMTAWSALQQFTKADFPMPGRVAAGCSPAFRKQLIDFCIATSAFADNLKEALRHADDTQVH